MQHANERWLCRRAEHRHQQLSTAVDPTAGRRRTNELRTTAGLRYDGADDLRSYRHLYDRRGYLNEIGTSKKYRRRVIVITQRMSAWRFFLFTCVLHFS